MKFSVKEVIWLFCGAIFGSNLALSMNTEVSYNSPYYEVVIYDPRNGDQAF